VAAMVISHHLPLQEAAAAEYRLASAEARRDDARRMHVRVREPTRTRRPRPETAAAEPELLTLQRTAGNQAVVRMLARAPTPAHVGIEPVSDIGGEKGEQDWADELKANQGVKRMYSELATLLHATALAHVKGTTPDDINGALRPTASELKPGLNFAARMESRGQCGYLYDDAFSSTLRVTRDGPLPPVAIVLGRAAFDGSSKASTLGVLRHELEHAFHDEMALHCVRAWRADGKAAKQPFLAWLEQQGGVAAADKDLVRERVRGSNTNTEALANLEGFIAAFPIETASGAKSSRSAYGELLDAAGYWLGADAAVKKEFIARLKALRARSKDATGFDAVMKRLKGENKAYAPIADGAVK
jgi:hypothetical protein